MIFCRKELKAISKQLDYQQKLLESIFDLLDTGQKQALKRQMNMRDYFGSIKTVIEGSGTDLNSPMFKPFKDIVEKIQNG